MNIPPVSRYWPVYVLVIAIAIGAGVLFYMLRSQQVPNMTAWALFYSAIGAGIALVANAWLQWTHSTVAHTMRVLLEMRSNPQYLICSRFVSFETRNCDGALTPELVEQFLDRNTESTVDNPSFRAASLFVLNHYEFLCASARAGVLDRRMLEQTIRANIVELWVKYMGVISCLRDETMNKRIYEHLEWLAEEFH